MKRRRAKYRVAPKTRNYSDVLRDVIKTQMDSFGEATRTIIKTEYGPNIHVSQKAANTSLDVSPEIKLERESPETCSYNRYQSEDPREGYRARSREKRYNDDRRGFHKDNFSSKERNTNYDDSHHSEHSTGFSSDLSRSREKRYVDDERRHHKDKYSSKERRRNYEESYQSEDSRDRSRGKRYDANRSSYHKDYSSKGMTKTYENYQRSGKAKHDIVIKQERASQEPESYKDYTSDRYRGRSRSRERRHHDYKNAYSKHSHKERNEKQDRRESNHENYSTIRDIKQEIELHNDDSYDNNERSRKRYRERSRSKEKPNKDNQKKHKVDKHSSRSKVHERRREPPPGITIKQERESP